MASPFVPKGREELLLRTPLTFGFSAPSNIYQPRNSASDMARDGFSGGESREQQRAKIKRMSRNTPHTGRVRPLRGLTDERICSVEDNLSRPRPMSALTNRDLGKGYRPPGSSRYSANSNKHIFAVGVVPVTYAWRDELLRKAQKAIDKALGRDKSPSRPQSRQSSRGAPRQFDHLDDKSLLDMMCQILHTDSIPRCQEWLNNAPEDQKDIVLNMIRTATLGEEGLEDLPTRPPSRYVWRPQQSRRHSDPLLGESLDRLSLNAHPRYIFSQLEGVGREGGVTSGGGDRLGLPTIPGTPGEDAMSVLHSSKRARQVKLALSQDASTQLDKSEVGVYDSTAARTSARNNEQRLKEKTKPKRKKQSEDPSSEKTLPPLHPNKETLKHQKQPHSSISQESSTQPRARRDQSRVQYTSH